MTANRFDVFVVGPTDRGPTAEARLATTLATQSGRPVTAIARALAEKNLRVGQGLPRDVAERIAREMQTFGAATALVPSAGGAPASNNLPPTPSPAHGFTLTPLSNPAALAPPSSAGGRPLMAPPTATGLAALRPDDPSTLGPPSTMGGFALQEPAARPASGAGMFAPPDAQEQALELQLAAPVPKAVPAETSTSISSLDRPSYTLAGASALNTSKIVATSSASGLSLSDDEAAHTQRCANHGLVFDRRKSKGCRRCVEGRRSANRGEPGRPPLREKPAQRAFVGLGFAVVLGFVPAAFYATQPGGAEVLRLRAEQKELSEKAGTQEILRRFDELDAQVDSSQTRNMRNTLFIWVATSGLTLFGFYRMT